VTVALLEQPDKLRLALSPLRKRLLERLREPASAAQLSAELGVPRQKLGYHLRLLEQAGLVELVEERRRRGCQERILRATAREFVVDPAVMGELQGEFQAGDRHAAEHLVAASAATVRHVTRMQARAGEQGKRLLTFTIEAAVSLAAPGELHRFSDELASAVAEVVASFDTPGGRAYRLVMGAHLAPATVGEDQ
jgi:DNA-binding transcriptional ArsR family regulator